MSANPVRGEAEIRVGDANVLLRPTFTALVAAEEELGSLFAMAERASEGQLALGEIVALFDHVSRENRPETVTRERIGEAVLAGGLANAMPALRTVLVQVLQGRS